MQAIIMKYHGPTDRRGSRVSATNPDGKRVFLTWNNALNSEKNHLEAAKALCTKMGWHGPMAGGGLKGACMVWVFTDTADNFLA